jgi:hypothetical protein
VECGGDTLSRYDVSFAPGETKLVSVTNPRLFPTKYRPPQLKLFALDEALGEGGWLKALGLEAYAPRSRGRSEALQGALFSCLEALWGHLIASSWCGSRGRPCRWRNGIRPAVRASGVRRRADTACRLPPPSVR